MSDALTRLDAAVNQQWPRSLAAGLTMSLADGTEILATVRVFESEYVRILGLLADRCDDHEVCDEPDCGAAFCETCRVGDVGLCGHGHPRCGDHWPASECTDCADILREQAEYDARDKPWGAPA